MPSFFPVIPLAINYHVLLTSMFEGFGYTFSIFLLTVIFSVPLGFLLALLRSSKSKFISKPVEWYNNIMRGTPLLLQLFVVFYGTNYLFHFSFPRFVAIIIAFVLNYAAYFCEIFRGGIESIPVGQHEAANVLGFTKTQTFFKIVLPQVIKIILPSASNEFITLVKDTALAQSIAIIELFRVAGTAASGASSPIPFLVAGVFYFIFNWIVNRLFIFFEKRLSYYK